MEKASNQPLELDRAEPEAARHRHRAILRRLFFRYVVEDEEWITSIAESPTLSAVREAFTEWQTREPSRRTEMDEPAEVLDWMPQALSPEDLDDIHARCEDVLDLLGIHDAELLANLEFAWLGTAMQLIDRDHADNYKYAKLPLPLARSWFSAERVEFTYQFPVMIRTYEEVKDDIEAWIRHEVRARLLQHIEWLRPQRGRPRNLESQARAMFLHQVKNSTKRAAASKVWNNPDSRKSVDDGVEYIRQLFAELEGREPEA